MNKLGAYKKKNSNVENVKARQTMLENAIRDPGKVNQYVAASLLGQRSFAALEIAGTDVRKMALNTMKSIADECITTVTDNGLTGFSYLNAKRIELHKILQSSNEKRARDPHVDTKTRLEEVELHNLYQSKAYLDLYSHLSGLATENAPAETIRVKLNIILKKHERLFRGFFDHPQTNTARATEHLELVETKERGAET